MNQVAVNLFRLKDIGNGDHIAYEVYNANGERKVDAETPPLHSVTLVNSGAEDVTINFSSGLFPVLNGSHVLAAGTSIELRAQFDGEISQEIVLQCSAGYTVEAKWTYGTFTKKLRKV